MPYPLRQKQDTFGMYKKVFKAIRVVLFQKYTTQRGCNRDAICNHYFRFLICTADFLPIAWKCVGTLIREFFTAKLSNKYDGHNLALAVVISEHFFLSLSSAR